MLYSCVPINFSEPRFEDKIKELRKIEKDRGSTRTINANSFYPKYELKSIVRKLKYQKLDEPFRFDIPCNQTLQRYFHKV